MDNLQPGQTLGAYRIVNQIGQGGMATVYKAYHAAMDRYVALKILPSQLKESKEFAGRFEQEARVIARLEHPHILPVFDYGESDGISYLVMRYLEAGTLKDKMSAGPLSITEIDRIFTQLTDALGYAHAQGIVHRDLKPANVLIDSLGNVFLTDFGIAKLLEGTSNFTQTDAIMGTPAYISPEQAQAQPVDQRSDLYSLGIILYEMVAGRVPFTADTPLAVMFKHVSDPLPLPSSINLDVPHQIETVILKALSKNPADRFATAAAFAQAWKRALAESGAALRPAAGARASDVPSTPATVTQSAKSSRSSVGLVIGCVVVLCLLMVGGGALLAFNWNSIAASFPTPAPQATQARATESVSDEPTRRADQPVGDWFEIAIGDEIARDEPGAGAGFIDEPGAKDIYTFTAEAGEEIYFHIIEPPQTSDLITLILLDDLGNEIYYSCLQCGDPGVITLERGGAYTLVIGNDDPNGAGTGAYRLKLWELFPPEEFEIAIGDDISKDEPGPGAGYIDIPGAKDIYFFTVEAGQTIYMQVKQQPQSNELLDIMLFDELETELLNTCLQCGDPGVILLERGGEYMLVVGNDSGPATGSYALRLWDVPPPDEFTIAIGDKVEKDDPGQGAGSIESPGAHDEYTFTAQAGQVVYFEVDKPPDTYDLITWVLVDDTGNEIFNTCLQCGDPGAFTLERGGEYTLIVGNDDGPGIGSYEFKLYVP